MVSSTAVDCVSMCNQNHRQERYGVAQGDVPPYLVTFRIITPVPDTMERERMGIKRCTLQPHHKSDGSCVGSKL